MLKKLHLLFFLLLILGSPLFAQVVDSTDTEDDEEFFERKHKRWWKNWANKDWTDWELRGTPFIEGNYGIGKIENKNMFYDFKRIGLAELKLGYSTREDFFDEKIIEFGDKYFFISRLGSDIIETDPKLNEMRSEMWRFGFAKRSGYGYKLGSFSILPYHARGFIWSRLHMKDFPPSVWPAIYPPLPGQIAAEKDKAFLDRINNTFRFGTNTEAGINFDIASSVGVNLGYEYSVLFPRHMFWKHLASLVIEGAGNSLLEKFIDEIADSTPLSVPFVNFVLKGAYSYAFHSLKKEKMNWPFNTETPLTYETIKFGMTFTF
ncbi:MAG: hypothetical protein FD143_2566 [Ignavibacteria bacterium]|nr:MAG: hypothetical protein FD143_2566 [Ignavibacteria bacterium]KAF0156410.1 MAG: hypothetical protein FD188_2980 [Ignavibacteria bacterium]